MAPGFWNNNLVDFCHQPVKGIERKSEYKRSYLMIVGSAVEVPVKYFVTSLHLAMKASSKNQALENTTEKHGKNKHEAKMFPMNNP